MGDYYYSQQMVSVLNDIYLLLQSLSTNVENILYSVVFFGLLFFAYNFISKRWLTLSC